MDMQLLDAIRIIIKQELKPANRRLSSIEARLDSVDLDIINLRADMSTGFRDINSRLEKQDGKLDAMLEAWSIQKQHRRQLDNHELRLTSVEDRISAIS